MELTETTRRELWRKVDVAQKGRLLQLAVGVMTLERLLLDEHHHLGVIRGLQVNNASLRAENERLREEANMLRLALHFTADVGQIAMCQKYILGVRIADMAAEIQRVARGEESSNRLAQPAPELLAPADECPTLRDH